MQAVSVFRDSRTRRSLVLIALLATVVAMLATAAVMWMSDDAPERATGGAPRMSHGSDTSRFAEVLQSNQQAHLDAPQAKFAVKRSGNSRLAFSEALPGEALKLLVAQGGVGLTESEPSAPPASAAGTLGVHRMDACETFDHRRACLQP